MFFPFPLERKGKKANSSIDTSKSPWFTTKTFSLLLPERKKSKFISPMHLNSYVFFNGYRAIGLACTKYQRLKEISMKEERPGQGPRRAATKADGVPHSRSQNEVTSSLTRTFGDATDPAWFTCRGQCYGYESIKI